jgi:hypothetical protein
MVSALAWGLGQQLCPTLEAQSQSELAGKKSAVQGNRVVTQIPEGPLTKAIPIGGKNGQELADRR